MESQDKKATGTRYHQSAFRATALAACRPSGWRIHTGRPYGSIALWLSLFIVSALALVLYIVGTPVYFAHLSTLCASCIDERLTPARFRALHALGVSMTAYAAYWTAINLLFTLVYCAVAAFIFRQKANDRITVFASFSLVALGVSFPDIPSTLAAVHPAWWLPATLLNASGLPSFVTFLFLFPTGRFIPGFTRWVALGFAVLYIPSTFFPDFVVSFIPWSRLLILLVILMIFGFLMFAQVYRYRYISTAEERQQTKWVIFGIIIGLLGFVLLAFLPLALLQLFPGQPLSLLLSVFLITGVYLVLLLIPLTLAIAMLRYRLWDIDLIINRTLVYSVLTVSLVSVYTLLVVSVGSLLRIQGNPVISLIAAGCIVVLFQPLRVRLQAAVNRLFYGQRDEPYTVMVQLGQRLKEALAPEDILSTIVETVARALKLPYVALLWKQEETFDLAASYGNPTGKSLLLPLVYQAETIGQLQLAPRSPGEAFTPADQRLLDELTRQIGVAIHAVRLTADLQHSRERLITMREEERRRLRRDLHDGLGPTLAGLSLKVGAVRNLLLPGQEVAATLLNELSVDIEGAVADIRRIVYDLRPPSLDELGLIGAIRSRAAQYSTQSGTLNVLVEAPQTLPALPAAIEVAVYHIVQEALTNVVRHAQAKTCRIRLSVDREVDIEIIDDGKGLSQSLHTGVGLFAMRERAIELGGTCVIEAAPSSGVRVHAQFPLARE